MYSRTMRLLDANLNRASEGLRVLEDVARFILDDRLLSRELKAARHEVSTLAQALAVLLLSQRDSVGDVGRESALPAGADPALVALVRANSKRVEESLRVIEECSRLPVLAGCVDTVQVERLRYATYDVEKRLVGRLLRVERRRSVSGLYVVVDRDTIGGGDLCRIAADAIDGGASVIQLRDKSGERGEVLREAKALCDLCRQRNVLFVMNDHADIAAAVGAPALHVGQTDLPVAVVRTLLPIDTVVGVSCSDRESVLRALEEGADYVAVGAVFPTAQKQDVVVTGLDLVRWARSQVGETPLVAIGGIGAHNVDDVVEAGAGCVAVISAVVSQPDVRQAARGLSQAIADAIARGGHDGNEPA